MFLFLKVEAERRKRANILESEGEASYGLCCWINNLLGVREAAINRAEGLRQSKILASEAMRIEQVNKAKGKANMPLK